MELFIQYLHCSSCFNAMQCSGKLHNVTGGFIFIICCMVSCCRANVTQESVIMKSMLKQTFRKARIMKYEVYRASMWWKRYVKMFPPLPNACWLIHHFSISVCVTKSTVEMCLPCWGSLIPETSQNPSQMLHRTAPKDVYVLRRCLCAIPLCPLLWLVMSISYTSLMCRL